MMRSDKETLLCEIFTQQQSNEMRGIFAEAEKNALRLQGHVPDFVLNFERFPFGEDTCDHLAHLLSLEAALGKGSLRILDLSCGGGDFTRIARARGHQVIATESDLGKDVPATPDDLTDMNMFRSYYRLQQRKINRVDADYLFINRDDLENLSFPPDLDLIYLNQCSLHFPTGGRPHWREGEWRLFLQACDRALRPHGMMFITLGEPTYLKLGDYLSRFYKYYFDFNPNGNRYWSTLLIHPQNRNSIWQKASSGADQTCYEVVGSPQKFI